MSYKGWTIKTWLDSGGRYGASASKNVDGYPVSIACFGDTKEEAIAQIKELIDDREQ